MAAQIHYSKEGRAFFVTRTKKDRPQFWLTTRRTAGSVSPATRMLRFSQAFAQCERPDGTKYYREVHDPNAFQTGGSVKPIDRTSEEFKDYALLCGWPC